MAKVPLVYLSVMVREDQLEALRLEAERRGAAMAEVAREWLDRGRPAESRAPEQGGQ